MAQTRANMTQIHQLHDLFTWLSNLSLSTFSLAWLVSVNLLDSANVCKKNNNIFINWYQFIVAAV